MPNRFALIPLALLLASVSVQAEDTPPEPTRLFVDAQASKVVYTVEHPLHSVVATSNEVEGTLALLPDGRLQVMVRAPVKSFDSANSSRDAHMLEVMDAVLHPYVVFKGVASSLEIPTTFPATVELELQGELDFRGRKQRETVPVRVTFDGARQLRALARFDISLSRYDVPLPSLMFVKLKDRCSIDVDLFLKGS